MFLFQTFILRHFNSRPREGGDGRRPEKERRFQISIRAPARGATSTCEKYIAWKKISIRAPARGATKS